MIALQPGSLVGGRYEIIRTIGAGGMGAVYLACDPRNRDFLIALKTLYPGVLRSEDARIRFRNEISACFNIDHPNIVRAFDYFDEPDLQAYAMEYVDGGDLQERLKHGSLDAQTVISVLKQLAAGLAAVHAQGIIHRDLKPENILITKKGLLKITDFGVARLKNSSNTTQVGMMVGTPRYVAPEYIETGECDHRGDIFALGIIGYEMLTGSAPYRVSTDDGLRNDRFSLPVAPILNLAPDCPVELAKIVERAMRVRIAERYQSAEQIYRDLVVLTENQRALREAQAPWAKETLRVDPYSLDKTMEVKRLPIAAPKSPQAWSRFAAALSLILLLSSIGVAVLWKNFASNQDLTWELLPNGNYSAVVSGLRPAHASDHFDLFKNERGVFVLFGRENCELSPLDRRGGFRCGDLKFKLELKSISSGKAEGIIQLIGEGESGRWSLAPRS